jgi:hypothetical protein
MSFRTSRRREWDGIGVWSSEPCHNPAALNRQAFTHLLALMHWDERFARAFRRAYQDYIEAGSPGVPLGSTDYRRKHARLARAGRFPRRAGVARYGPCRRHLETHKIKR